jgi:TolB-like protein
MTLPGSRAIVLDRPVKKDRPALAVMNFSRSNDSQALCFLARGLCVDINAHLARLSHLFTIARPSADAASLLEEPSKIAARLGVRYLVYGQLFATDSRCRITLSLVDAEQGEELWAEQLDHALDGLLLLQQELIHSLVAAIDDALTRAEIDRAIRLPSQHLGAWEYYHRGMWHVDRPTASDIAQAIENFQQAIQLDPGLCRAYAGLSIIYTNRVFINVGGDTRQDMAIAKDMALMALSHDARDALANWAWGKVLYLAGDLAQSVRVFGKVVADYPNYAHAHLAKAVVEAHSDNGMQALQDLAAGEQLSPCDPLQFAQDTMRAIALAQLRDFSAAADWALRAIAAPNAYFMTYAVAAACTWLDGRESQSRGLAKQILLEQPHFTVSDYRHSFPCRDEASRVVFVEAMASSGLPMSKAS